MELSLFVVVEAHLTSVVVLKGVVTMNADGAHQAAF
jgi:hypothetical protein